MPTELERLLTTAFDKGATDDAAIAAFKAARHIVTTQGAYDHASFCQMASINEPPAFPFGKYKGELVDDVATHDMPYLRWFAKTVDNKPELTRYIDNIIRKWQQL